MARYDDLETKSIALSTLVSCILLVILIFGGRALAYAWEGYFEEIRTEKAKYGSSDDAIAAQKAILKSSGKVQDPPLKEGEAPVTRITVPVSKAQEIIGKELGVKPKT